MSDAGAKRNRVRPALLVLAVMLAVVPVVTTNLTAFGIGSLPLLYDVLELPRLIISVLAGLLAMVLLLVESSHTKVEPRASLTLWLLLALAGISVASTFTSLDPRLSVLGQSERLEGVVTYGLYMLLFAVGLNAVRGVRDLRALGAGLAVAAGISALYGVSQAAGFDPTSYALESPLFDMRRSFATFGNPNFLAGFLVLALPVVAGLAAEARSPRRGTVLWALVALIAAAALLSFTRSAWLALALQAALALAAIFTHRLRLNALARRALMAVVAVIVALGVLSVGRGGEIDVVRRVTDLGERSSFTERILGWEAATSATLERPLLGYGPGTFLPAFRQHRPDAYAEAFGAESAVNNAHNWPLQVSATLGIPAALVLMAAIVLALWSSGRVVWRIPPSKETSASPATPGPLYTGVWLGCVGYVVHMMLSVAVHGATTPFWLLLGALVAPVARTLPGPWDTLRARKALTGVALLSLGAAVALSAIVVAADSAYLGARAAYRGGSSGDALALAARAERLNPLSVKYARGHAEIIADRYYAASDSQDSVNAFTEADAAFLAVRERYPNDYAAAAWHAALLASGARTQPDGDLEARALAVAERAAELDRHAERVQPLLEGRTDSGAVNAALGTYGLP